MIEDKLLADAHVLLHPIRYKCVVLLQDGSMHINAISKALGAERRLVTFHLQTLEDYGFLNSKYEISNEPTSRGRALRKYWRTDKVDQVLKALKAINVGEKPAPE